MYSTNPKFKDQYLQNLEWEKDTELYGDSIYAVKLGD